MAYGDSKDLARRTGSDKIMHDKQFNIANNPKYVLKIKSCKIKSYLKNYSNQLYENLRKEKYINLL